MRRTAAPAHAPLLPLALAAALLAGMLPVGPAAAQSGPQTAPSGGAATPAADVPAAVAVQAPFTLELKQLLETELAAGAGERRVRDLAALQSLYRDLGWRPLWTDAQGADARAEALVAVLAEAASHGLDPEDYGASALAALMGATRPDLRAEFEVRLGLGVMGYAHDLARGRTVPGEVFAENHLEPAPIERVAILTRLHALPPDRVVERLAALAPSLPWYERLRDALAALRAERAAGTVWPRVEAGDILDPGMDDPRVAQVRARLRASGDLTEAEDAAGGDPAKRTVYDPALEAALRAFQARHGLAVDGRVGPNTRAALNVPLAARVRQVMLNLERLRWMPDDLGRSHLLVNLADFSVAGTFAAAEGGERLYWTRAVVGTPYNRTPVFSDRMEYLEINPYWNVPHSIATKELLPKIKEDVGYLAAHDYEVLASWSDTATPLDPAAIDWAALGRSNFPYRLRQRPGPQNALGRIKFMFPNRFHVYLHDTPARGLFDKPSRAFSHGCVRLDKPLELAEILLRADPAWTAERIQQVIDSGERTIVSLPETVPVHLTYLTAWVDDQGALQFRRDIYERDAALTAALLEPRAHLN